MRTPLLAGLVFLTGLTAAQAQAPVCTQKIDALMGEWNAIGFREASKPSAEATGAAGHKHAQASLDVMKTHIRMAAQQCKEGKDHSALLHLDVVRAWLRLEDEAHPAWHFTPPG